MRYDQRLRSVLTYREIDGQSPKFTIRAADRRNDAEWCVSQRFH